MKIANIARGNVESGEIILILESKAEAQAFYAVFEAANKAKLFRGGSKARKLCNQIEAELCCF